MTAMSFLSSLLVLVFSVVLFSVQCHGRNSDELGALLELKASLDPEGRFLSSWAKDGDPCRGDFEGVACNEHGMVANITLQGKGLSGSISPAVARLKSLSALFLHYNAITGKIPKEIGDLTELSELYLNVNSLSGTVPVEIGNLGNLQVLELCYNQLTGSIPNQLGLLKKLNVLALQYNHLTGAIPASLGDLDELSRLDLSFNHFFGPIPVKLALLPQLVMLDVRNNTLSGSVPLELKTLGDGFLYANNTDLCGSGFSTLRLCTSADLLNPRRPEPYGPKNTATNSNQQGIPQSANVHAPCTTDASTPCTTHSSHSATIPITIAMVVIVGGGLISGLLTLTWYRRRHKQKIGSSLDVADTSRLSTDRGKDVCGVTTKSASSLISIEYSNGWDPLTDAAGSGGIVAGLFSSEDESRNYYRFNLEEVEVATQYFSDVNLLGRSNFAATFKGILRDGSVVAVKSINKTSCKTEEAEFLKGLKVVTSLRHDNLVGLRGFCCSRGRGECFLVYDFVANGSLSRYLDVKGEGDCGGMVLDWSTRVAIVKGIAKGIEYLHSTTATKPPLVHQNISADNVIIDHHYKPLLSGSGLHKLLADDVVYSTLKGSAAMGYLAPEYTTTGRFTEKSDVFAFGVILFQVLTGKRRTAHLNLGAETGKLEDLVDGNLQGNFSRPEAAKLAGIALMCTSETPAQRPTMESVLQELNSAKTSHEVE